MGAPMIYTIAISSPGSHTVRSVFFAAIDTHTALATTQRLGAALNQIAPTQVAGPRMTCRTTAELLGWRDAQGGPDSFDPMLLGDADYRTAYRAARVAIAGPNGLTPREAHETLLF